MNWEEIDEEVDGILNVFAYDYVEGVDKLRELVYRKMRNFEIAESASGVAENRRKQIEQLEKKIEELEAVCVRQVTLL